MVMSLNTGDGIWGAASVVLSCESILPQKKPCQGFEFLAGLRLRLETVRQFETV